MSSLQIGRRSKSSGGRGGGGLLPLGNQGSAQYFPLAAFPGLAVMKELLNNMQGQARPQQRGRTPRHHLASAGPQDLVISSKLKRQVESNKKQGVWPLGPFLQFLGPTNDSCLGTLRLQAWL